MKPLIAFIAYFSIYFSMSALTPQSMIRFHCAEDTTEINTILAETNNRSGIKSLTLDLAKHFIGRKYIPKTLEADKEYLTINIHEFDCVTFVESIIALTQTAQRSHTTWRDYAQHLESIRYRKGSMGGYASRLHYISDWIADNTYRGNIKEITQNFEGVTTMTKTLNYMSRNADKYSALEDSTNLAEIKKVEMGYRSHLIPYLKKQFLAKKSVCQQLKDGDIVVILSKTEGLDASHVGFIALIDDVPHLLHASTLNNKIELEQIDLNEYLKRHARNAPGVRILRIVQ